MHLRDILAARLRNQHRQDQFKQSGYIYEQNLKNRYTSDESLSDQATTMLERVKVMRVFELAGLVEAISEVGEICEAAKRKIDEQIEAHKRAKKNTIADSEDESEDELSQTLGDPMVSSDFRKSADMQAARLLVVDSVSNIVGPIISKSQAQGIEEFNPNPGCKLMIHRAGSSYKLNAISPPPLCEIRHLHYCH